MTATPSNHPSRSRTCPPHHPAVHARRRPGGERRRRLDGPARPVERVDRSDSPTSSLAGTISPRQDLRGEHARDAARLAAEAQIQHGQDVRKAFFLRRQASQDLRGEHAQDAARFNGTMPSRGTPPVYWSYAYQAPKPAPQPVSAPVSKPTGGDTDIWLILAIALGATGIVAASALVVSRRSRVRVPA